jgi:hypothetical protein
MVKTFEQKTKDFFVLAGLISIILFISTLVFPNFYLPFVSDCYKVTLVFPGITVPQIVTLFFGCLVFVGIGIALTMNQSQNQTKSILGKFIGLILLIAFSGIILSSFFQIFPFCIKASISVFVAFISPFILSLLVILFSQN